MRRWLIVSLAIFGASTAAVADTPVSTSSTAVMISSDATLTPSASGCSSCDAAGHTKLGRHIQSHARPEPYCLGCSTLRCEWRFFFGSCRAFYGEGRFKPALPPLPVEP